MTHDGPGDDTHHDKMIREDKERRQFKRSSYYPDPEHSTHFDVEVAFQRWQRAARRLARERVNL